MSDDALVSKKRSYADVDVDVDVNVDMDEKSQSISESFTVNEDENDVAKKIDVVTESLVKITREIRLTKTRQRFIQSEINFYDDEYYAQKERFRKSLRSLYEELPLEPKKHLKNLKSDLQLRQEEMDSLLITTMELEEELITTKKINHEAHLRNQKQMNLSKMIFES